MEQLNTWNFPIFDLVEKIGRKCGRILSQVRNAFIRVTLNVGKKKKPKTPWLVKALYMLDTGGDFRWRKEILVPHIL